MTLLLITVLPSYRYLQDNIAKSSMMYKFSELAIPKCRYAVSLA